jgi:Fe-S-cluster containining protein
MDLLARAALPADVPCGSCRSCCKSDRIVLCGKDDPTAFKWHYENGLRVVDRKANNECVYLAEGGCSVHDAPPDVCRRFDCRVLYLLTPKTKRRIRIQQNPTMKDVYHAGKARLDTLR